MAERWSQGTQRRRRQRRMAAQVGARERRKLRARRRGDRSLWFGLGTYGVVGWSVVVPTLLGVALGIWIDTTWPGRFSWTLMGLFAGLGGGCWSAWYWVSREQRAIGAEAPGTGTADSRRGEEDDDG